MAKIEGTIALDGMPISTEIVVLDAETKAVAKTGTSTAQGDYSIDIFTTGDYYVMAIPPEGYRPLIHGPVFVEHTGDPLWESVVALLSFDGNLIDKTGKTWSGQNIAFTAAAFGDGVMFTRGSARSRVQSEMHPDFSLGADDFTIEFLAKIDTSYNCTLIDWRSGSSSANPLIESDGGNLYLWLYNGYRIGPFPDVIDPDFLHHIALTRESGLGRLFLDGILLGSAAYPESITNTQVTVGANQNASRSDYDLTGVVDELRITKGIARYTENFTPPNAPFPAG